MPQRSRTAEAAAPVGKTPTLLLPVIAIGVIAVVLIAWIATTAAADRGPESLSFG